MRLLIILFTAAVLCDRLLIALFLRAMGVSEATQKDIFTELGLTQPQWSRQINGAEPPRFLSRLSRLQSDKGQSTVRWYHFLASVTLGVPEDVQRARPMLKMALQLEQAQARERQAS